MRTLAPAGLRCICILIFLLAPGAAFADLKMLEGDHTVVYDIVNPRGVAFIPSYSNATFEQTIVSQDEFSKRVQVISRMRPLRSKTPYPAPAGVIPEGCRHYLAQEKDRQSQDPAITRLAADIVKDSRTITEAANNILSWIADNLTFDSSITVPADAVSAYRYRKAYCVGYSNLAVALLRAAGIPARVAHGYLPPGYEWGFSKEYWGVKVNDGGFHAYLEIYYPDIGWVFSDAEHSHNFVDPFHIILRLDGMEMPGVYKGGYLDVDKATFYTIFREEDHTVLVDELPLPKQKRLGLRISDRQNAAIISGLVKTLSGSPVARGTAVLWKDGRGVPHPFSDGKYLVAVTTPGTYRLELKGAGLTKSSVSLTVEQGKTYHQDFALAPGGTVRGKVTAGGGRTIADGDVFYRDGDTSFGIPLDQDGTYRIEGLAAGQYKLTVTIGDKTVVHQVTVSAGRDTVQDFLFP